MSGGMAGGGGSGITQQTEQNSTPAADNSNNSGLINYIWRGDYVTLPTTYKFYKLTAVEIKNGATVNGNLMVGCMKVTTNPPTLATTQIVAQSPVTAQTGVSTTQKIPVVQTALVAGGDTVVPFVYFGSNTAVIRGITISSANVYKNTATFPASGELIPLDQTTAWSADTAKLWAQLYYVGYN